MPWIPLYADDADFELLHQWINDCEELAYIIADGPRRWRAVSKIERLNDRRICLWHVPSGPLPLLHPQPSDTVESIVDPWSGWTELRTGADLSQPYFGPGHVGVFWLNRRPTPRSDPAKIGMSSFEWIGNHYRVIGEPADPSTEKLWKRLRGWTQKQSVKIPRSGPIQSGGEIFAFPSALAKITGGMPRDGNPSP